MRVADRWAALPRGAPSVLYASHRSTSSMVVTMFGNRPAVGRFSSLPIIERSCAATLRPEARGPTEVDYSLYLITDSAMARSRGRPLEEIVEEAVRGGVTIVQVREKEASTRDFIELSRRIKRVTARYGVPLIINDRIDVALAAEADGVHVGQKDMDAATARTILDSSEASRSRGKRLLLGVTASNEADARAAELAGADYLGTSAVFTTSTKTDGGAGYVIGPERVASIWRTTSLPVVAVGGINHTNAAQLIRSVHRGGAGATGVGVVSAIINADSPRAAAERIAAAVASVRPNYAPELAVMAAEALARVRSRRPLIQNVTNYVVMNDTANATLQAGGSPVMAHENAEMTQHAHALVLNMGTLDDHWLRQMEAIGQAANRRNIPVVLDPVGAGATRYRTESAVRLLDTLHADVLRGNAGELAALHAKICSHEVSQQGSQLMRGVDSAGDPADKYAIVRQLARSKQSVVTMTGKHDVLSDGERLVEVHNNHMLLSQVTGTGCMATSVIGAFVGALSSKDSTSLLNATSAALAYYCHAAERAGARTIAANLGPGSFRTALLDELFRVSPHDLELHARLVEV